jgi:hypothetical protein
MKNLNCVWIRSANNPKLYKCQYCNSISSTDFVPHNRVCPFLLKEASDDPNVRNIKKIHESKYDPLNQFQIWWNSKNLLREQKPNKILDTTEPQQDSNKVKCTQQQIDERLSICKSCEFYENETCLKCGCSLSREKNFMNKLYWADKSCPIGKWGPVKVKDRK